MDHMRYPHWIHGPRGTAPSGTTFQGSNDEPHIPAFVLSNRKTESPQPLDYQPPPVFPPIKQKEIGELKQESTKELANNNKEIKVHTGQILPLLNIPKRSMSIDNHRSETTTTPVQTSDKFEESSIEFSGDDATLSSRSASQSRSTLKSPGMITLHSLSTVAGSPVLNTPKSSKKIILAPTRVDTTSLHLKSNQKASSGLKLPRSHHDRNAFKATAIELLQKSSTNISLENKTGAFTFDDPDGSDHVTRKKGYYERIEGIAYDDDNQFQMEKGYSMMEEDVKEDCEWKYGVEAPTEDKSAKKLPILENATPKLVVVSDVNAKNGQRVGKEETKAEEDDDKENEADEEEEDNEEEEEEEGEEDEEDVAETDFKHNLDENSLETVMSIIYSNSGTDPDQMTVCYNAPLTPIVE